MLNVKVQIRIVYMKCLEFIIQEHNKIPYNSLQYQNLWKEGMRLPDYRPGLERWFFQWQWRNPQFENSDNTNDTDTDCPGYYASYVIGAQWFDREKALPLVVTTKPGCNRVDFLKMFSVCLNSGIEPEMFSRIYGVDLEQPRIKCPELNSVLSPLIVAHFVSVVKIIVKKGLKKDYVSKTENLKKVKGRIDLFKNERKNIIPKRFDRVFCRYQEYSENTLENRLIKKALLFSEQVLNIASLSRSIASLQYAVKQCLSSFTNVDEHIETSEVKAFKRNKLYKEYVVAIKLAQMILRRYDYSITNITNVEQEYCPVFWLDMSLLYEHYVLGLLKEEYGDKIIYQAYGYSGYPDFICNSPKIVMDAKYIPRFECAKLDTYIVRQLSGYSRDKRLFKSCPDSNIPCVVIYPIEGTAENPFKGKSIDALLINEDKYFWNFYSIAVPLPVLSVGKDYTSRKG